MAMLGSNSISSEVYGHGAITLDEKKKRRKLSNRESARRSRLKRQQYAKDLNDQMVHFSAENGEIDAKCEDIKRRYAGVELENGKLRKLGEELKGGCTCWRKLWIPISSHDSFLQELSIEEPWHQIQPPFQSQGVAGR